MTSDIGEAAPETVVPDRNDRREFFRNLGLAGAFGVSAAMAGLPSAAQAQAAAPTDADVFNFALNLEYLEANFYSIALTGAPLPGNMTNGTGNMGAVNAAGAHQVTFTDAGVRAMAREIGANERAHVNFVRSQLGNAAIAQPVLDLSVSPTSAFSAAARAAGLIGANQAFDPYANDESFLLATFLFEEVGVTAYKGASPLITNKTFLEAAAGILAVEAYHASMARTMLWMKGINEPGSTAIDKTEAISNARDSLDGASDLDQGVRQTGTGTNVTSNIAPLDGDGIAFSRTTGQVLNIAYLTRTQVDRGGFFPNGVNGSIRQSAAN